MRHQLPFEWILDEAMRHCSPLQKQHLPHPFAAQNLPPGRQGQARNPRQYLPLPDHIIDLVRRALKGESLVNPEAAFTCLRSYPHGHVAAVLGSLKKLDLHTLIAGRHSRPRDLVVAMIVARVIDAGSKLATARALNPESAVSTLGQVLQLGAVNENEPYEAMDWLVRRQWGIEKRLAKRHLSDNTLMLYET